MSSRDQDPMIGPKVIFPIAFLMAIATIRKHPANELKSLLCWRNGKTSATYIINEIH